MINSIISNKTLLLQLIVEQQSDKHSYGNKPLQVFTDAQITLLMNYVFWQKLNVIKDVLNPVSAVIGVIEGDVALAADVPILFRSLAVILKKAVSSNPNVIPGFSMLVTKCINHGLLNQVYVSQAHLADCLLHPKYIKKLSKFFTSREIMTTVTWISNYFQATALSQEAQSVLNETPSSSHVK